MDELCILLPGALQRSCGLAMRPSPVPGREDANCGLGVFSSVQQAIEDGGGARRNVFLQCSRRASAPQRVARQLLKNLRQPGARLQIEIRLLKEILHP